MTVTARDTSTRMYLTTIAKTVQDGIKAKRMKGAVLCWLDADGTPHFFLTDSTAKEELGGLAALAAYTLTK